MTEITVTGREGEPFGLVCCFKSHATAMVMLRQLVHLPHFLHGQA